MLPTWSKNKIFNRLLLLVLTSALIVYFMPHEHRFTYDYDEGKPWKYSQLIAEYDFPIYKSQEQLKAERDSVLRFLRPFFRLDESIASAQVENLRSDLGQSLSMPLLMREKTLRLLGEVYSQGVVSQHDYDLVIDSVENIRILRDGLNDALVRSSGDVLSPRMAYEWILKRTDSLGISREWMGRCNLNNYITPNLVFDETRTGTERAELLAQIAPSRGMVQSGQKIIDRGEIVTPHTLRVLQSLQAESEKRSSSTQEVLLLVGGQFLCVMVLLSVFMTFLVLYRPDYARQIRSVLLLFSLIVIFTVASSLAAQSTELNVYVVPLAMVTIFIRVFMDSRTAFAAMLMIISICSLSLHSPYEFMLLEIVAGLTAIYSLKELTSRSQLMRAVLLITGLTILVKLGYDLSQGFILSTLDLSWYVRILINGVLLLFAYPLMLLFEKLFGFISSVTLVELSNVNTPLLRRMSKEAQGTFNHSMQVANLSAEVASKIGADVQLVRTAALYHDIGKLNNPAFFTENQVGLNPHDQLSEPESAQIIIRHVFDGMEMADKHQLPPIIKECIATHHGRGKTKYFYINYLNKHPQEPVNEELFTYPGPNPKTKEQAILMMADSVEAASRSLKEINEVSLRKLVDSIIDAQVSEGFFRDCPITFRDVTVTKDVLVSSLRTIYHTRISYPTVQMPPTNPQQKDE